ncbi:SCO3933 family regulatory protein [Streptomyces sp. NPDC003442]
MAMTRIRVGLLPSTQFIAGTLPVPKVKDPNTGEVATDRDTGETLHTLTVFLMEEGRAEQMKITVPENGLPGGLQPGMPVRVAELFATPWARLFNGQLSDGVAYRAAALELVK